jgi:Flp pilus assembly pilin Flp
LAWKEFGMKIFRFKKDESGAVTVDWVVLTAAIVGLALGVLAILRDGPRNVAERIAGYISGVPIGE